MARGKTKAKAQRMIQAMQQYEENLADADYDHYQDLHRQRNTCWNYHKRSSRNLIPAAFSEWKASSGQETIHASVTVNTLFQEMHTNLRKLTLLYLGANRDEYSCKGIAHCITLFHRVKTSLLEQGFPLSPANLSLTLSI